jgi:DNA-directed RNA polymerase subunit E'/Rpb7
MPTVNVPEVKVLSEDPLYLPSLKHESLAVPFEHAGRNMESYFTSYAQEHLEGRCWKEGFVRPGSSKVVSYSAGRLQGTTIEYNVLYQVQVFYPYEHMEVECVVRQINKIGIRATVRERQNPLVAYVTREHNADLDFSLYKQGQLIRVKVLGHRFESGDPTIAVLAEIIPPLESVSSAPPRNLALA